MSSKNSTGINIGSTVPIKFAASELLSHKILCGSDISVTLLCSIVSPRCLNLLILSTLCSFTGFRSKGVVSINSRNMLVDFDTVNKAGAVEL